MNTVMMASSLPPERSHSDGNAKQYEVNEYAKKLIHHTARKLVGRAGLSVSDIEDLEGDLTVELLKRRPKYDPSRAAYNTFVANVVRAKARKILRARRQERRDPSREKCSLNEHIEAKTGHKTERVATLSREEDDRRLGGRSESEKRDMAIDMETMLSKLPDDTRDLCELVKIMPVAEAARHLGIPDSTAYSRLKALRTMFSDAGIEEY